MRKLQRFFLTTLIGGIVVVLPISIFFLLIRFVFRVIADLLTPISLLFDFPPGVQQWLVDLLSFGVVIGSFFLIGLLVRTGFGKRSLNFIEETLLKQLPLYMVLRDTVQQFAGQKRMPFSRVVLVDAFGSGALMTGFVAEELGDDMYTIFVPTAPNPTNGFVFHMPGSRLKFLDIRPEDAMRTVIGLGIGSSNLFQTGNPRVVRNKK